LAVNIFDRSVKALARRYPQPFARVALGSFEDLTVETIENPEINLPLTGSMPGRLPPGNCANCRRC